MVLLTQASIAFYIIPFSWTFSLLRVLAKLLFCMQANLFPTRGHRELMHNNELGLQGKLKLKISAFLFKTCHLVRWSSFADCSGRLKVFKGTNYIVSVPIIPKGILLYNFKSHFWSKWLPSSAVFTT